MFILLLEWIFLALLVRTEIVYIISCINDKRDKK